MKRITLLLSVFVLWTGCGGPVRRPPEQNGHQVIRVALPSVPRLADRMQDAVGASGLFRLGRAGRPEPDLVESIRSEGICYRLKLKKHYRLQDGTPLDGEHILTLWEEELGRDASPLKRIFEGIDRFSVVRGGLELCSFAGLENLPLRLADPAAWPGISDGRGAGPFSPVPDEGRAVANPDFPDQPELDEIIWVPFGTETADVQVVYGSSEGHEGMTVRRIPTWDRIWYLEVDPEARWVNDPTFRRWLAERIDRAGMAEVLFGGDAEATETGAPDAGPRPVSAGARPRLGIVHDVNSPVAKRIVSRLRADLMANRIVVEAAVANPDRATAFHLRFHDPVFADPEYNEVLPKRAGESDTVIPLIRERAYLLTRVGLSGITAGPAGVLHFETARWTP